MHLFATKKVPDLSGYSIKARKNEYDYFTGYHRYLLSADIYRK